LKKKLFNLVKQKYSCAVEQEFLVLSIAQGLWDYEELFIQKYLTTPAKVLVIGCGAGRECIPLQKKGFEVFGIDFIPEIITKARQLSDNIKYLVMDAVSLGFKAESFDAVLMLSQFLSLIPTKSDRLQTLKEVRRVLVPNGILILSTHSRYKTQQERKKWLIIDSWRKFIKILFPFLPVLEPGDKWVVAISGFLLSPGKVLLHLYTPEELISELKETGFSLLEYKNSIEILDQINLPHRREKDPYIFYAARKEDY